MRILLINPPWIKRKGNVWNNIASVMPPMGLAWIAAVLEQAGHHVEIVDAHAERMDLDQIRLRLETLENFDLVGITATTPLIRNALEISRIVKLIAPETVTVLGGVHPTVMPDEVLEEMSVDIVVRGEGEETIKEIARQDPLDRIDGISYRDGKRIIHNSDRKLIEDLNSLPMPAWHLLPMDKYHPAAGAAKRLPAISMLSTRGCPGRCSFCYRIFGKKIRVLSGRKVAEQVKHLCDNYGIREICFYDDTFTFSKKEVRAFCQGLDDLDLDITWSCFSRVDTVNEEMLCDIKNHGCHQISYGIESASLEILKNIGKRADIEKARTAVALAKKVGLDVRAAFMLGNPGETAETMEETLRFAIDLAPDIAMFNITTPFPGTEMFKWAKEKNYLTTMDWEEYDLSSPVLHLPTLAPEEIKAFYKKAYRRFFLRPAYVAKRVAGLRRIANLVDAFRALKAIINT